MQIGNIPSAARCSEAQEGSIIVALLLIPYKSKSLDNKTEKVEIQHNALLYHMILNLVLDSLRKSARDGVELDCTDRYIQ